MNEEALECMLSTNDKQRPLPDLAYVEKAKAGRSHPSPPSAGIQRSSTLMVISIVVFAKCMKTGVKK